MSLQEQAGAQAPVYHPLQPVQCISFLETKGRKKNLRWALKADIPRLYNGKPGLGTVLVPTQPKLSIIGGGPSLNETYKNIKGDTMVCGSAHDHVVKLGIKPTYAVECDPSLAQVKQYQENSEGTIYLVASRCDKTMFKHLKGREVYLWHMWEQDLGKETYQGEHAYICGATVFLSAIPIALSLGYNEFEFHGVDSSFETFEQNHAYPQEEGAQVLEVRVGNPETGRQFKTTATWVGQAQQYQDMVKNWGHMFKGNFHGNGLLAEMERMAGRQQ